MPAITDRALLLELTVFSVDNNIRRGVLSVAANVPATDGNITEQSRRLSPGESWTFTSVPNNSGTVVRVQGGPANAEIQRQLATWDTTIKSVFVCTDTLGNLTFSNPAGAPADILVRVLQA